jgi:hypothetical protein
VPLCLGFCVFFFRCSSSFPQTGVCWKCYPLQHSCTDYFSFSPSEGTGVPDLWWGIRDSLTVVVGSARSLCTVGSRSSSTCRVEDCYLVEKLEFELLNRKDRTVLQGDAVGSAGPLCTLVMQFFWCHPLSIRLQFSSLQWGIWCHPHSLMEKQGLCHSQTW